MSTVSVLEALQSFLQEKVSPAIKLQKPSDNNIHEYSLVNPAIHVGWLPPKGYLPEGMESAIPCLIVGLDDATDDGQDSQINIRISVVVFSPGFHTPGETGVNYIPDFKGYHDLLNVIDRTVAELMKNQIIDGKVAIQMPVKWGMYQEQPYPYWYGWITFPVKKQTYPTAEIARQFL
ncbi:hypothetical protein [Calorimonas adulescens]|uniref:Uncharacterized protein n=1 Tax=Calorimonas adulescens TaxID=2606906 RepID=A0A5D8QD01_9THEO|nr:hypothetical protein [Calorimonas adulescens]TZE81999.1 hypothetical protein FWJ32_07135 [Calorimonas adulescens]